MGQQSPICLSFPGFGKNYGNTTVPGTAQISNGSSSQPIFGLAIAPDSEIDTCWIVGPDLPLQGGIEDRQLPVAGNFPTARRPNRSMLKLSVEHPIIGPFNGPLFVSPFYSYGGQAADQRLQSTDPAGAALAFDILAKLSILVYTEPTRSLPATRRAPIEAGWTKQLASLLFLPTFGRKMARIFATCSDVGPGTITVGYGFCTPDGQQFSFTADALTVPASNAGPSALPAGMAFVTSALPHFMFIQGDPTGVHTNISAVAYD